MAKFDASSWARYIRGHKNPLVVAGEGCEHISLEGRKLSDYAVEVALRLSCPVAATGNTFLTVTRHEGVKAKKMWLAELFRYLEGKWEDAVCEVRPDLLVLIGYRPDILNGMVAGARRIHTVFLGPGRLPAAHRSMDEVPFAQWRRDLEELIEAL